MELSIIISIYAEKRRISKILNSFLKQSSKNFQLIIIVDSFKKDALDRILEFKEKFGEGNLIIALNSNRQGFIKNISQVSKVIKGRYVLNLNPSIEIQNNFVVNLLTLIKIFDSDIIEFNIKFEGKISWEPRRRLIVNRVVKIKDNPEVVAYSHPFLLNKIIKTSVLRKALELRQHRNSNFLLSVNLIYSIFFLAKTYANSHKILFTLIHISKKAFNPIVFFSDWDEITKYIQLNNPKLSNEIEYAKSRHLKLIVPSYIRGLQDSTFSKAKDFARLRINSHKFSSNLFKNLNADFLITKISNGYLEKLINFENSTLKIVAKTNKYFMNDLPEASLLQTDIEKINYSKVLRKIA